MRPHLKFLLPDIKTANQASEALLLARIDDKNISFLANPSIDLGQLRPASAIESTNVVNEAEKGILIGGAIGLLIGLYMHYFQPWITESMNVHWMVIVGVLTIFGAALSAIGAAVFGTNFFNDDLKNYESKIEQGAILMIVSAPFQRSNEIRKIVRKLHLKF